MSEPWKLVVGFAGVVVGFLAGLRGLVAIMDRSGGALFDHGPAVTVLVSIGMCGGGAALVGYLALGIVGFAEKRVKRSKRRKKKSKR